MTRETLSETIRHRSAPMPTAAVADMRWSILILATLTVTCSARQTHGVETIHFQRGDQNHFVSGRTIVEAEDGGLLLESSDGVLWAVEPQETVAINRTDDEFAPLNGQQLATALLNELPAGFQAHHTAHYVVCYNTSRDYAMWCGGLFERLHRAFTNFWDRRGLMLHEPEFPLPVIIFSDANQYAAFAHDELGEAASSIVAYYSLRTNRVVMFDLTGVELVRSQQGQGGRALSIGALLSQPTAEPLVATIVHEATHQIAFNCGLHTRYSDVPLWFSEGLAIYFETPDLSSSRGWRGIGQVNYRRLGAFRDNLNGRSSDRLQQLIASDRLFRDTTSGPGAYADAWVLTYYLLRTREKDYVAYLQSLAKKPRLVWDDEQARLTEFYKHFGTDLKSLDDELQAYIARLR